MDLPLRGVEGTVEEILDGPRHVKPKFSGVPTAGRRTREILGAGREGAQHPRLHLVGLGAGAVQHRLGHCAGYGRSASGTRIRRCFTAARQHSNSCRRSRNPAFPRRAKLARFRGGAGFASNASPHPDPEESPAATVRGRRRRARARERLARRFAAVSFVAFMGPSGSGKVDAAQPRLRASIARPTGEVVVAGERLNDLSEDELAHWRARHVGLIFQFFNLMPVLNARDNVALPLLLTDLDKRERRRRAETALRVVGLGRAARPLPAHALRRRAAARRDRAGDRHRPRPDRRRRADRRSRRAQRRGDPRPAARSSRTTSARPSSWSRTIRARCASSTTPTTSTRACCSKARRRQRAASDDRIAGAGASVVAAELRRGAARR